MNHRTTIDINGDTHYFHDDGTLTTKRSGCPEVPAYELMACMAAAEERLLMLRQALIDMQHMLDERT